MRETNDVRTARDTARFVPLRLVNAFDPLVERSQAEPVILFQHDPYCPISRRAYRELARLPIEAAVIDVAQEGHISRIVEARTGVAHESPQVLVLRSGKVVWSASHYKITHRAVARAIQRAASGELVESSESERGTGCGCGSTVSKRRPTESPNLTGWLRAMCHGQ